MPLQVGVDRYELDHQSFVLLRQNDLEMHATHEFRFGSWNDTSLETVDCDSEEMSILVHPPIVSIQ